MSKRVRTTRKKEPDEPEPKPKHKYTLAKSFVLTDLLIAFGVGAIMGGAIGIVGTLIGVLCVFGGWAATKLFKKEVKPNEG